jgi:hypothetical protein
MIEVTGDGDAGHARGLRGTATAKREEGRIARQR